MYMNVMFLHFLLFTCVTCVRINDDDDDDELQSNGDQIAVECRSNDGRIVTL